MSLPMPELTMKCIWNKSKVIPDTHIHNINIQIQTSADIESLKQFLTETLNGVMGNIATQTNADEKLISIN